MKCKKTFTLFEVLIVLALIATLGTVLLANGLNMIKKIQSDRDFHVLEALVQEAQLAAELTHKELHITISNQKNGLKAEVRGLNCKNLKSSLTLKNLNLTSQETFNYYFRPHLGTRSQLKLKLEYSRHQVRELTIN